MLALRTRRHEDTEPARGEFLDTIDAFVADDLEGRHRVVRAEQPRIGQRLQEIAHLPLEPRPGRPLGAFEHGPACPALDRCHQQQVAALRRQQRGLDAGRGTAGERLDRQHPRCRRTQRLQRIDTVGQQPLPLRVAQHALWPRAGPQQQLVVVTRLPGRALRIVTGQRAGHGAAVREDLGPAPQAVGRHDPRETHQRMVRTELELVQSAQRLVAGFPRHRRIDHQHRVQFPAAALSDDQHAGPDVAVTRERRYAQKADLVVGGQREQSGARLARTDQVVVGQRSAVVTVRVGVDVSDRVARAGTDRRVRARGRDVAADAGEHGLLQRGRDEAARRRHDRQAAEYLLVLDVLRAAESHALQHEIEAIGLGGPDVVVVDRRPQCLSRTGTQRLERQRIRPAGQRNRRRASAVDDAYDDRGSTAVLEILLDGIGQRARLPQPAEDRVKFGEARHRHGALDRTPQRTAHEGGHGGRKACDRAFRARRFRHEYSPSASFPHDHVPARATARASGTLAQLFVLLAALRHQPLVGAAGVQLRRRRRRGPAP